MPAFDNHPLQNHTMTISIEEIIAYLLVAGAVFMGARAFMGGDIAGEFDAKHEPGWKRLPPVFKFFWSMSIAFEDTVGATLAKMMPLSAARYESLAKVAALPLNGKRVFACMFFLTLAMLVAGALACFAIMLLIPEMKPAWNFCVISMLAVVGWFLPGQDLAARAEHRQAELTRQLPFAIDLIGSAMRSGLDFGAAVRYYTELKSGGALEEEFTTVLNDVTMHKPFIDALRDMAKRIQLEAFTAFVGIVAYGTEIGASIADTLKRQGKDLRKMRFAYAERKAARAPSVMIVPLVCFIMPAVFIVIITPVVLKYKAMGLQEYITTH